MVYDDTTNTVYLWTPNSDTLDNYKLDGSTFKSIYDVANMIIAYHFDSEYLFFAG